MIADAGSLVDAWVGRVIADCGLLVDSWPGRVIADAGSFDGRVWTA